uniref:RING-type E3 ubiquitin transferase n=1 Tax=Crassostrea virginica TaxID=6565 RepID=A0A8B8EI36_CRAVI|nr:uncharacterized protein LOC111134504 isoform X2 [Crassostrea virginica]
MATGSEKHVTVDEITDGVNTMSLKEDEGQQILDIQECWSKAKVCISGEDSKEKVLSWTPAYHLQYMVQRKSDVLNEVLKEFGCCVDKEKSQEFLTVSVMKKLPSGEFLSIKSIEKILEKIQGACEGIYSKSILFKESKLPFLENDFSQAEEKCFKDGLVQIIHEDSNRYILVGLEDEVKKSFACLEKLSKKIVIEKIENRELFDVLKLKENLEAAYRNIEIIENEFQVVFKGPEKDVVKCAELYNGWSHFTLLKVASDKISENLFRKLTSDSKRKDIYKFLMERGISVFLFPLWNDHGCFLFCYGITEEGLKDALEFVKRAEDEIDQSAKFNDLRKVHGQKVEHTARVIKIKRGISFENVESRKKVIEKKTSCSILLTKREAKEPFYHKSWINNNRNIVIAEGNVENSVTDIIVCPVDENFQPAGESAERIFLKGGWTELENAAQYCKSTCKFHSDPAATDPKNCICFSSATGSLNCRKILFLSLKNNMELLLNNLCYEVVKNGWGSIYFSIDHSQISDGMFESILAYFTNGTKSLTYFEVVLCIPRGEDLKSLEVMCDKHLHKPTIRFFIGDTERNEDALPCSCLSSPIEVKIKTGSILDFACEVDAIVNSTNRVLKLDDGFVSKLIVKHGGWKIQEDLKTQYKDGIGHGDVAVSIPGKLKCRGIIHCVLHDWISVGNLSCKVLSSVVKKCLQAVEKEGFSSVALPALGTGKLKYSYLHVARTMLKAVEEYGKAFPQTRIKRVYFVLHQSDQECLKTFSHVCGTKNHENEISIKDLIQKPEIQFLEFHMPTQSLLIQLMSEEIDEPVDAIFRLTLIPSKSKNKWGGSQELTSDSLVWSKDQSCYTAIFSVDHQSLESVVGKCFTLLKSKRMTSTRIDIKDIGANGDFEKVMDAFSRKLNSSFWGSLKMNTENEEIRYLRTLQILTRQAEIEKIKNEQLKKSYLPSWLTNLWKTEWKVVERKKDRDLVCCATGPTKGTTEIALEDLKKEIGAQSVGSVRYCFCRDYKWRLLSKACNIKLCEAEESGFQNIDIKSEDGIIYSYNFEEMERHQEESHGVARKEKLLIIQGGSQIPFPPRTSLWCVKQNQIWTFLPMHCCELLNKAAKDKSLVVDEEKYEYDLNNMTRKKRIDDKWKSEEILFVIAEENKDLKHIKEVKNEEENVVEIFESVSGKISYGEEGNSMDINELKRELKKLGCTVTSIENNRFGIKGNFSQIKKVSKLLQNHDKKTEDLEYQNVIFIAMSERDYKVLMHFGDIRDWFKQYRNSINFDGHGLTCAVPNNENEKIEEDIKKHLQEVRQMSSLSDQMTDETKELIQGLATKYPNVYLFVNEKSIEIISDSYEDVVKLHDMLKPKVPAKTSRRAARRFAKADNTENQGELSSSSACNTRDNAFDAVTFTSQTTTPSGTLELKTAEGLLIKVYTGSITKLNVDCIVNAANENLMHGGGVAAAISEAAGYKFDKESAQYIEDNGPVPVGSCCVTSAGKLPYKCVIHTVGPRWSDYRDSNVCLELLKKSVEVSFKSADVEGMNSVAIPAISSGIFGVPKDKCVEQYYKAAMSFCSTYPCKSLREIHFVDRDESMVRAIKEVFQQNQPATSASLTSMSKNPLKQDDTMENSKLLDEKNQIETPPSSGYTIVTVSDTLQIKMYLGSITDIAADVIVCPQDAFCSSDNPIAQSIFSKKPGPKPLRNQMKQGQTLIQIHSDASPWKMIIHAVFPIYDENYAKNPSNFGSQFYPIIQTLITTADEKRYHSIAIPLLVEGKGEFQAPMEICAFYFYKAVTDVQSKLACVKEIYLVLRNEGDEHFVVEMFKDAIKITRRPLLTQSNNFGSNKKFAKTLTSKPEEEETCCICMDTLNNPKKLQKCGHVFCTGCIEDYFKYKPACPSCGQIYGKMTGDQPTGTISIRKEYQTLEGFSDCKGTIVLTYSFHNGRQGEEHPNPGTPYKGIYRSGYVPNNAKGRLVAKLLNVAFSRRLVFTIGNSRTTGEDGVITWNDIHHKTRTHGGPQRFGYPDPTYLDRVLEELAAKGVTPESADDPQEYTEYSKAIRY